MAHIRRIFVLSKYFYMAYTFIISDESVNADGFVIQRMSAKRPGGTVRSRWGVRLQFSQQQGEKHGLQHRFSRHISAHQLPVPKPLFG